MVLEKLYDARDPEEGACSRMIIEKHKKPTSLLEQSEREEFQARWQTIQLEFVDEPRTAVQEADALITEVVDHLSERLGYEKDHLKEGWTPETELSREELRLSLQHYRRFFDRLLSG